jgi:hypothetical protein
MSPRPLTFASSPKLLSLSHGHQYKIARSRLPSFLYLPPHNCFFLQRHYPPPFTTPKVSYFMKSKNLSLMKKIFGTSLLLIPTKYIFGTYRDLFYGKIYLVFFQTKLKGYVAS